MGVALVRGTVPDLHVRHPAKRESSLQRRVIRLATSHGRKAKYLRQWSGFSNQTFRIG